jgi:predicted phosphodiesterase
MSKKNDGLKECELDGCQGRFEPKQTGTQREKRFCSKSHQEKWHVQEASRQRAEAKKVPGKQYKCAREGCSNLFTPDRFHADGTPIQVYCGRRCKEIADNERQRQDRAKMPEPERQPETPPATAAPTDDLIAEMHRRGFFVTKQPQKSGERFTVDLSMFEGDKIIFGVVSDSHLCSKQQQLSHLRSFYKLCSQREIDTILHAGDLCEGDGAQHKGQGYDLFVHGMDEQTEYVAEVYPEEPGITTHFILGSHDNSFWKSAGYDIGKAVAKYRSDMKYLGFFDAYVDIAPNVDVNLHHPDGGTAYALSYNAQKKVEAYPPELKPRIAIFGHYHRTMWMPAYRNCDTFLTPCFQSQTKFLKEKKIYPIIGGWIIEATCNENGLANIKPECIRFYVPVTDDY